MRQALRSTGSRERARSDGDGVVVLGRLVGEAERRVQPERAVVLDGDLEVHAVDPRVVRLPADPTEQVPADALALQLRVDREAVDAPALLALVQPERRDDRAVALGDQRRLAGRREVERVDLVPERVGEERLDRLRVGGGGPAQRERGSSTGPSATAPTSASACSE